MPDIRDQLDQIWSAIARPAAPDAVVAQRLPNCHPNRPVYIGVGGDNARHILIPVPSGTPRVMQRSTRGLDVVTSTYTIGDRPEGDYIDLCCRSVSLFQTFATFAEDLVRVVSDAAGSARDAVLSVLARWRAFWLATSSPLTHEQLLGLFGELWFAHRWLAARLPEAINAWNGPDGARHDFQWPAASVEVKVAQSGSTSGVVHRISSLDQLDDPPSGTLYLFSLQAIPDAQSQNTLAALVDSIRSSPLVTPTGLIEFDRKLALTGYAADDPSIPELRLRVVSERLYRLAAGFPRLTRRTFANGVPVGVENIVYTVNTSACSPWLIADCPEAVDASFVTHLDLCDSRASHA